MSGAGTDRNEALYQFMRRQAPAVRESARHKYGFPYSERHLQCLWYDGRLRPATLVSAEGEQVLVEDPGRWNLEPGPDFLDATLLVGPERRRISGDVEVHVHSSDWFAHGHSADPRYSRVVAHVTFFKAIRPVEHRPSRGILHLCLKDIMNCDPALVFEGIDTAAYPFHAHATPAPCSVALRRLENEVLMNLLDCAGIERLRLKSMRISARTREVGAHQAFYEETLCALGYRDNRIPFRRLAHVIPLELLRSASNHDPDAALVLLLGLSGLLPGKISPRWDTETRAYLRKAWNFWWKKQSAFQPLAMQAGEWTLSGLRPQNHPIRRMVAASVLFCGQNPLPEALLSADGLEPAELIARARHVFARVRPAVYWQRHLSFSSAPGLHSTAVLGQDRVSAIVSNVVVPFLAASGRLSLDALPGVSSLSAEQDSSLVRQAAFRLMRSDRSSRLYRTALRQQGLLQVFYDFCLNDRSGCKDCTFPAALQQWLAGTKPARC